MKIKCKCSNAIVDETDYISYKAHYISDQDIFDFFDAVDANIEQMVAALDDPLVLKNWRTAFFGEGHPEQDAKKLLPSIVRNLHSRYERLMYQCTKCGRLYLDDINRELHCFKPQDNSVSKRLLISQEGANWRGFLFGEWKSEEEKGDVYYEHPVNGFLKNFNEWEDLQHEYLKWYEELKGKNQVRSAFLRKDGQVMHKWFQ